MNSRVHSNLPYLMESFLLLIVSGSKNFSRRLYIFIIFALYEFFLWPYIFYVFLSDDLYIIVVFYFLQFKIDFSALPSHN